MFNKRIGSEIYSWISLWADEAMYDDKDEAIEFAEYLNWDVSNGPEWEGRLKDEHHKEGRKKNGTSKIQN